MTEPLTIDHVAAREHERRINLRLVHLGARPVRGRIERAREIVEEVLPPQFSYEFTQGPTGPIEIMVTVGVKKRFET